MPSRTKLCYNIQKGITASKKIPESIKDETYAAST